MNDATARVRGPVSAGLQAGPRTRRAAIARPGPWPRSEGPSGCGGLATTPGRRGPATPGSAGLLREACRPFAVALEDYQAGALPAGGPCLPLAPARRRTGVA